MTRVATPENEACLLNIAWHGTATHVERTVGEYRRALRGEERLRSEQQHEHRSVRWWWDDDGSLVLVGADLSAKGTPPRIGIRG